MADKKISDLPSESLPEAEDLFLIITDPSGTPVSKSISLKTLLSNLPSNTSVGDQLTVSANSEFQGVAFFDGNTHVSGTFKANNDHIQIQDRVAMSSNNPTNVFGSNTSQGYISYDEDFLYVATSNSTVKRVPLNVFS